MEHPKTCNACHWKFFLCFLQSIAFTSKWTNLKFREKSVRFQLSEKLHLIICVEASATPDGWLRCHRSCSWAVHELIGDSPPCLSTEIQRAAYAILWMGLRGEREGLPSMLATSFAEAAGVSGRQKWGLVLSSSARVSQVTYQTVVGVRYPELVTFNGTQWKFVQVRPTEKSAARWLPSYFFEMSHVLTYMLLKTLGRW